MTLTKEQWNTAVSQSPRGSFLQSWEWGDMQAELSVPRWRLVVEHEGKPAAVALVIKREVPGGRSWLYVPRGPVFLTDTNIPDVWLQMQEQLTELAQQEQALFVRIEPVWSEVALQTVKEKLGEQYLFRRADRDIQPAHTLMLDVTPDTKDILAAMHKKTRYNIRLGQRKGVTVRFTTDKEGVDHFLQLSHEVHERSQFRYHPDKYYRAMHQVLGQTGTLEFGIAEHEGKVLAVHILISFADTVTYAHGASSSQSRSVMAPHVLQWESIKRAKEYHHVQWYDFFGIAPPDAGDEHSWAGITRFKIGFGGERVSYIGAQDLILNQFLYNSFILARRVRSLLS